jgi:hypothetical protein
MRGESPKKSQTFPHTAWWQRLAEEAIEYGKKLPYLAKSVKRFSAKWQLGKTGGILAENPLQSIVIQSFHGIWEGQTWREKSSLGQPVKIVARPP